MSKNTNDSGCDDVLGQLYFRRDDAPDSLLKEIARVMGPDVEQHNFAYHLSGDPASKQHEHPDTRARGGSDEGHYRTHGSSQTCAECAFDQKIGTSGVNLL